MICTQRLTERETVLGFDQPPKTEVECTLNVQIRTVKFPRVGEASLAIFRHSPGLKGRTSDSSGFSTKEGSAALLTQGMKHSGEWKRRTVRDEADKEW